VSEGLVSRVEAAVAKAKKTTMRAAGTSTPGSRATAKKTDMVVVLSGDRSVHDVAADLKSAGFEVQHVLDAINQVTGRAAPALKPRLKTIQGVQDVSEAHEPFKIAPPDAPIQ
jgi:hypothetical protein